MLSTGCNTTSKQAIPTSVLNSRLYVIFMKHCFGSTAVVFTSVSCRCCPAHFRHSRFHENLFIQTKFVHFLGCQHPQFAIKKHFWQFLRWIYVIMCVASSALFHLSDSYFWRWSEKTWALSKQGNVSKAGYICTHMHATLLHVSSPALPHSILLCGAAISHRLAVKHQGIFKTDLAGIIWLQPWWMQEDSEWGQWEQGSFIQTHKN